MKTEEFKNLNNQLQNQWRQMKKEGEIGFVWDGIIDYDHWSSCDLKLLFIAREAYSNKDEEWDYTEEYREGKGRVEYKKSQGFHNRINEWSFAVDAALHDKIDVVRKNAYENDYEKSRLSTLSSALINIKKIGGAKTSSLDELRSIAIRDKDLLQKQIDLINPNTILFCGTFCDILINIMFGDAISINGTKRCYEMNGKLLIDFFHPTRCYVESFDDLILEIKNIRDKAKYLK